MAHLSLDLYQVLLLTLGLAIPLAFLFSTYFKPPPPIIDESQEPYRVKKPSTMQAPSTTGGPSPTEPPKTEQYSLEQLKAYDGNGPDGKIYVAVKGASRVSAVSRY